jgi:copper chaperone CopZ
MPFLDETQKFLSGELSLKRRCLMQRRIISLAISALLLSLSVSVGCRDESQEPAAEPAAVSNAEKIEVFHIEGMTCENCVQAITDRLQKMEGVQQVRVSLEAAAAWVHLDPQNAPDNDAIITAIESLGFKAKPLEVETLTTQTAPAE